MPKKHRLSRLDFARIARARVRRHHGRFFSLVSVPLSDTKGAKAACVVSKKCAARAVDRNRIERRCRSVLRPLMPGFPHGVALVFYAKRESRGVTFTEIESDIRKLVNMVR
ncbi:ribonuclease P protein component [Candidatus Kaiserbacteria bacterium RIFCSPLOWO2_01_FULL_54_22]|nr:MAG: ribonuclease P protein component [Candidatus Kaiserbacteria bacterium RIFCSPLOWO2_01_FULL_54_22]